MIIYFADRELNILGHASTMLPAGYRVFDDLTVEEVGTGVNTFSCSLSFTDESRADLEEAVQVGCFILKQSDADDSDNTYDSLYQIIETETDTKTQEIHLYAEDAGLDLLNTLCPAVTLTGNISYMLRYFLPSDWSLSISDAPTTSKTYAWDGESTATERLMSVANLFDCELYYSFVIEGLQVKSKVLNVEQRRGEQTATAQLRLNYDVDRIYTKKSIADLVTAYNVTGGTPEGSETPINLKGYSYSYTDPVTGDVYRVDSATGQMRNISAMARWSSVIDSDGLWVGSFTFDTTDKSILAGQARASLQKESQVAVNYEVDFARLPEGTRIGDRINIIDELGELYLEARLLQIETCAANDTKKAVIGEYLIREGGISEKVAQLASDLANQREADKVIQAQMQIITDTVDGMFTLEVDSDVVLSQAYLTARLLKGNKDIKTDYNPDWFKWILRSENGERLLGRGYTLTVNMKIIGYASTILCRFIRPQLYDLTDHNLTAITDANLDPIQVSFAGIYNQPVVTRNLLKSRLKSLRTTPTVEVGEPTVSREVNLYEKGALGTMPQHFWVDETGEFAGVHITEIDKNEYKADPQNGGGNLLATSTGISVRDGEIDLAVFGADGVQIGIDGESHIEMDYHSLQLYDFRGNSYFHVSDLRGRAGTYEATQKLHGDGTTTLFQFAYSATEIISVTIDEVSTSDYTLQGRSYIRFNTAPANGATIVIVYVTNDAVTAFTFGKRWYNSIVSPHSFASGYNVEASGVGSHAEGYFSFATGNYAHAEGSSRAEGDFSHSEGNTAYAKGLLSHAECEGHALGDYSHAEGHSYAEGKWSHASGVTIAEDDYMTAIGKPNNTKNNAAFVIGNGSDVLWTESDAMVVSWNGNTKIAGTLTQSSDRRLKDHRAYLSDDAVEFINELRPAHFFKDGRSHVGFYAQDVRDADKWNCMTDEMNGFLTLGYTELIAPLVAYVQKLEERVAELEKER